MRAEDYAVKMGLIGKISCQMIMKCVARIYTFCPRRDLIHVAVVLLSFYTYIHHQVSKSRESMVQFVKAIMIQKIAHHHLQPISTLNQKNFVLVPPIIQKIKTPLMGRDSAGRQKCPRMARRKTCRLALISTDR